MLRPSMLLPALVVAGLSLVALGPTAPPSQADAPSSVVAAMPAAQHPSNASSSTRANRRPKASEGGPLAVTIDTLSPSVIPTKGVVRITGSVTNTDREAWVAINVHPVVSTTPITSTAELAEAAELDPLAALCCRIVEPGTFDTIDSLEPGESAQFTIRLPRSEIAASAAGVYWLGIHAIGEGPELRDGVADGRARTFIPLVPRTRKSVDTALVVPLRHQLSYEADGRIERVEGWTTSLAPGGRLRSLLEFGASAGPRPISWLLDPAVPDSVRALADGNPARSLEPAAPDGEPEPSPSPTLQPDPSDSGADPLSDPTGTAGDSPDDLVAQAAASEAADAWLARLRNALGSGQILALPYGNLDVSAAAEHDPVRYEQARRRSGTALQPWGLRMTSAVASPRGFLDSDAIDLLDASTTVVVTDRMFPDGAPTVARTRGKRLIPSSIGAASGGPGPDDRLAAVALRQRILSEAALRLLSPGRPPLVVVFPQSWTPTGTAGFFSGLDVDWLHLTTVSGVGARAATPVGVDELRYPAREQRLELETATFAAAAELRASAQTLQAVLTENETIADEVAAESLTALSYSSRRHESASRASLARSRAWVKAQLGSIQIDAPLGVTLSSASGRFAPTLTNRLNQRVTVGIQARGDDSVEISGPTSVTLGPGESTSVLLTASTDVPGVHQITLAVTDLSGTLLGSSDDMPLRYAQVSQVIWVILGGGAALLFGAIAVRLVRRIRGAKATPAP